MLNRRGFLSFLGTGIVAAPAIVRAEVLMRLRGIVMPKPTLIVVNNKLIVFRKEVTREYIRQNLFNPFIGAEMTAIIRVIGDIKNGGEQIPLIARLKAA